MQIASAKLTGTPDESGWVQAQDFQKELFVVVKVLSERASHGRGVIKRFQEEYFRDLESGVFKALTSAAEVVLKEFSEESVALGAVCIKDDLVYAAVIGKAQFGLFRNGSISKILNGNAGVVSTASGKVMLNDAVLVSTGSFFEGIDEVAITSALSTSLPQESVEALAPIIHAGVDQGTKGLIIVKFLEEMLVVQEEMTKPSAPRLILGRFRRLPSVKKRELGFEDTKRRKTAVTAGSMLIVILLLSIGFGLRQQGVKNSKSDHDTKISEVKHDLEEAKALFSLDPGRARELFAAGQKNLDELAKTSIDKAEIDQLQKQFDEDKQSVLGEFDIAPDEFVDLSLYDGFLGSKMVAEGGNVYVFDKGKKRIFETEIGTKKTEVKIGPSQIGKLGELAVYAGRIFTLEDDGIFEVRSTSHDKAVAKNWGDGPLVNAYAGNLYVLDKSASKISRFPGASVGFGSGSSWLAPGILPDLSSVVSWTIDGSVWMLSDKGKVQKYTLGSPQDPGDFKVVPGLVNPTMIFTNEDQQNVYIAEPGASRIVVFGKDGSYKAQYKSDIIKEIVGLAASEKDKKIIVLTKDKLYSLPINP